MNEYEVPTVAVVRKDSDSGYAIINKADLKKGDKVLSAAELAKLKAKVK